MNINIWPFNRDSRKQYVLTHHDPKMMRDTPICYGANKSELEEEARRLTAEARKQRISGYYRVLGENEFVANKNK